MTTTTSSDETVLTAAAANEAPEDIALSNTTVLESARTGFEVGVLSATDPEAEEITWSLVDGEGDNDEKFKLRENSDGTVSVVLSSPLDYENSPTYSLVAMATDASGDSTTRTIEITVTDEAFKLSSAPTGRNYTSVVENSAKGTKIGYLIEFDSGADIVSYKLTDDADGAFKITPLKTDGETHYFLSADKVLNFEQQSRYSVTIEATDTDGNSHEKTIDVEVLDASEAGDATRGAITIDAETLAAAEKGGVNWNTYLDKAFKSATDGLPTFLGSEETVVLSDGVPIYTGWGEENPATQFLYAANNQGNRMLIEGSSLIYNWSDPETGEDLHTVSGEINSIAFGTGSTADNYFTMTDQELTISGLDLSNEATKSSRIDGETNLTATAFMYGTSTTPVPTAAEYLKALLASYAQKFLGSSSTDTYSGTIFGDTIHGNGGADRINGAAGYDWLKGGSGADRLTGGSGADDLYGGGGKDVFVFGSVSQSVQSTHDTIFDFDGKSGDRIDLSGIDASTNKAKEQDFDFIGNSDFSQHAGEMRFERAGGETVIEADTNGDGAADLVLHLDDAVTLKDDFFVL